MHATRNSLEKSSQRKVGITKRRTISPLNERKMAIAETLAECFPKAKQHLSILADWRISAERIRRATRRCDEKVDLQNLVDD